MAYKVKLNVFEGPFDLLVYLIERSGVDIYDVNISEITDQYMKYTEAIGKIDPEAAAEFMVLSATLLQIKSAMLLPGQPRAAQKSARPDPREELAEKLREYKKYKALAEKLRVLEEEADRIFTKPAEDFSAYTGQQREYLETDPEKFMEAFRSFLERKKRIEDIRKRYGNLPKDRMTMEEKAENVLRKLKDGGELSFCDLLSPEGSLYDQVLTFTALLELTARGRTAVRQDSLFGEIRTSLKKNKSKEESGAHGQRQHQA